VADSDSPPDRDLGPRWTEGPLFGSDRPEEAQAIALFRDATGLPPLSAVSSQRVWRRLSQAGHSRRLLRPAVLLGLALAASTAVAASVAVIRGLTRPEAPRLAPVVPPAPRMSLASPVGTPARPPLVIRAADVPAVAKAKAKRRRRAPEASARPAAQKTVAALATASPDEGTLGKETALFREALSLRAARDPRAAIAVLDRYAATYPRGSYAAEVVVLRGELSADAGDCAAATASFDRAITAASSPGLEERALYGRASCHLRAGHRAAARVDLERYLLRFPQGRYAPHARAALAH
jgi:hypothetical protein